ncbi:hypothetical protein U9M48_008249 [Paspalum notatum var. saurae]|uniref:Uncharacterized protein n=1 Tax=Paspalum notatum var. saurae TaxID=547442 RepID=A0AAQ3SNP8_PASNO
MESSDEEKPLIHPQPPPQALAASEYASDGSVDINKQPALKRSTGKWRACFLILGVEFCECLAFFSISQNLVTYLTTVLHESKVAAARNVSAWAGSCFLTPLLGAFVADTYWGRYKTIVVFFPLYILAMAVLIASSSLPVFSDDDVHRSVVYIGIYLAAIGSGGVKPCTSAFGADQFDTTDPDETVKKGSFFNWYYFMISTSSVLSGTFVVWLQDNVGWTVSYVIPALLMLVCFPLFLAGSKTYRFRKMGASPLKSVLQVIVAAVSKWQMELPDDSSRLFELPSAAHRIKHTNEFKFFDKAAIKIVTSDNQVSSSSSSWRLCTVTQVEELKMLLRMFPVWASFLAFYAVSSLTGPTLVEQGMFMDNRVGSFAIPPASMAVLSSLSLLAWVPIYEAVLVPLARRLTGNHKGISGTLRLGIGQALCTLSMVYAALLETARLAAAEAQGLTDQSVPAPMSILWQAPVYVLNGAAQVFGGIGVTEYFYDKSPQSMRSLCAALANLAIASGSYISSAVLAIVAVATTHDGAPGWIPDNLNQGHLDYFYWLWAFLSFLSLALFLHYSIRHTGNV